MPISLLGEHFHDEMSVFPLRQHIREWFRKGAPIDPQGQGAPAGTLRIVVRQLTLAISSMSRWHDDCRLWLRYPEVRPRTEAGREKLRRDMERIKFAKPFNEDWIPWNLALYAPKGTPYEALNKKGFEVTVDGSKTRAEFPDEPAPARTPRVEVARS